MARYDRGYGRDYGRSDYPFQQIGGMRSDSPPNRDWRSFAGEEGWYGEGYEGMPNDEFGTRRSLDEWNRGGRYGSRRGDPRMRYGAEFGHDYGGEFRSGYHLRGGGQAGWDFGYPGRSSMYEQGPYGGGTLSTMGRGGRMRASDLMTSEPETVTPEATLAEAAQKMRDLNVGIIPVVDASNGGNRLRGVITDRDIAVRGIAQGHDGNAKVSECMTEGVRSANKNDSVQDVMRIMREEQVRRVPITDREGRLVGIISQADLAVDLARDNPFYERQVESTIERISEPARPQRSSSQMSARS